MTKQDLTKVQGRPHFMRTDEQSLKAAGSRRGFTFVALLVEVAPVV